MSFKIGSFLSSLAKDAVNSSIAHSQDTKSNARHEPDAQALNFLASKMPGANRDANALLSLKSKGILINNLSDKASDPPEKTPRVLLDEILQKQPVTVNDENNAKVKTTMKAGKSPDAMTGDDYRNAFRRAVYTQAMDGVKLSDAEIKMADKALVDGGHYKTYFNLQGNVDQLRASQKQSGSQMPVSIGKENIEYARRAGQAVLQYESAKAEKFDSNQAKASSETNQMLVDPARLGGNMIVRWGERTLNVPRELLRQADRGELLPGTATAKWIGTQIAERITGQTAPPMPTASESIENLTGAKLPSIPEIKLPRPFEYQTDKYKQGGKTGEEVGATLIDLALLRSGIIGKSNLPEILEITVPLKNGATAAKIGVTNATSELDPYVARQVGETIADNPVATKAYSQMQKNGTRVDLDFGTPPASDRLGEFFRFENKMKIYMQNNGSAKEAVATMVHETSHGKSLQAGRQFSSQMDEYRAFTREFLFKEGRKPTLLERKELWKDIQDLYSDRPLEKSPFNDKK